MKIWHTGCTHMVHEDLEVPDVDILLHSGDYTNSRINYQNYQELEIFLDWVSKLSIPYKIFTPGNHSTYEYNHQKKSRQMFEEAGARLVIDDTITIEGFNITCSPYTPNFGNWSFMAERNKIGKRWDRLITESTDILLTHGPPKGILDLTENSNGKLEMAGDNSLLKSIKENSNIKLHCFSHIHSSRTIENTGVLERYGKKFSNASAVKDGMTYFCSIS